MKTMINDTTCNPSNARGAPGRAGAILAWLALALNLPGICVQAQSLGISNSVLLSWPEPATEQIVIGASSPDSNAVWTPWPEPIFKRQGQLCMAVRTSASQQFFKLVPGTQFIDDFSDPAEPFATRNPWVKYFFNSSDASRFSFTVTNGALRIQTLAGPVDGRIVIIPPGPLATLPRFRDFVSSVDILSFASSGSAYLDIYARGTIDSPFPGNSNAYLGGFHLNPTKLGMWDGANHFDGPVLTYDPAAAYRLHFSAVGPNLVLRVVNLTTGQIVEQGLTNYRFSQGYVTLAVEAEPGKSFDITLDNFFMTGTKP